MTYLSYMMKFILLHIAGMLQFFLMFRHVDMIFHILLYMNFTKEAVWVKSTSDYYVFMQRWHRRFWNNLLINTIKTYANSILFRNIIFNVIHDVKFNNPNNIMQKKNPLWLNHATNWRGRYITNKYWVEGCGYPKPEKKSAK